MNALGSPPCVVSFSGGRDSSALLAIAVHVAEKHGLSRPIAVTNVIPGDDAAAEDEWQESVIRHLGVTDWERIRIADDMDVVGPIAAPLLRRFGPYFPFNGHFVVPGMERARGGTYLSGVGGDELFDSAETDRLVLAATGKVRPGRHDLLTMVQLLQPRELRVRRLMREIEPVPWLQPDVGRSFLRGLATSVATRHFWFSNQLRFAWLDRSRQALEQTLAAFAALSSTKNVLPFMDPDLMRSLIHHKGRIPWKSRSAAMQELFGDVLPPRSSRGRARRLSTRFSSTATAVP